VLEAMASGLAVVTTPNSGSVIRDGVDGFVVRYDDVETMAQRVQALIDDPGLRAEMGRQAAARIAHFNLDWYATQLRDVFAGCLACDD
jgi:glycosyltransferase involved in cell wall biosynthesis